MAMFQEEVFRMITFILTDLYFPINIFFAYI